MGIRYYAYPVAPQNIDEVSKNPERFLSSDPLADAWGLEPVGPNEYAMDVNPRPRMLYLDKCWSLMQRLTHQSTQPRPAYALVAGDVIPDGFGWRPHVAALTPAEVIQVADDLDALADDELAGFCESLEEDDADYLNYHFEQARSFTRELAQSGEGLVYTIG